MCLYRETQKYRNTHVKISESAHSIQSHVASNVEFVFQSTNCDDICVRTGGTA